MVMRWIKAVLAAACVMGLPAQAALAQAQQPSLYGGMGPLPQPVEIDQPESWSPIAETPDADPVPDAASTGEASFIPASVPAEQAIPPQIAAEQSKALGDPTTPGKLLSGSLQTIAALIGVIAVAVGAAWLFRRLAGVAGGFSASMGPAGRAPSGLLEVLGRYPLPGKLTLVMLKFDRRVLLMAQSAGPRGAGSTMTTLCELTDPEDVASVLLKVRQADGTSIAKQFEAVLSDAGAQADAIAESRQQERDESPMRRTVVSPDGDRAELWNDSAIDTPTIHVRTDTDAIGALKQRLDSLRSGMRA